AGKPRNDANGNPIFVNSDGQVVSEGTAGAIRAYDLSNDLYTANGSNPDHVYLRSENSYRHTVNALTTYDWRINTANEFKFMVGLNRVTTDGKYNWTQRTNLLDIANPQFDLAVG